VYSVRRDPATSHSRCDFGQSNAFNTTRATQTRIVILCDVLSLLPSRYNKSFFYYDNKVDINVMLE
jgi:hypothetical protein